jgi:hypothetical protein
MGARQRSFGATCQFGQLTAYRIARVVAPNRPEYRRIARPQSLSSHLQLQMALPVNHKLLV